MSLKRFLVQENQLEESRTDPKISITDRNEPRILMKLPALIIEFSFLIESTNVIYNKHFP